MLRVKNESGQWVEDEEGIMQSFQTYYKNLFEEEELRTLEDVLSVIKPVVSEEIKCALDSEISPDEVRNAVFQLGANKAPGPNGYNGCFFQSYWDIVGPEVTSAVLNFFSTGMMPESLKSIDLVLIPKVIGPEDLSHYRPISLCNFAYKIVSKIFVNQLKPFLPVFVSKE